MNARERRIDLLDQRIEQRLMLLDRAVVSLRVIVFGVLESGGRGRRYWTFRLGLALSTMRVFPSGALARAGRAVAPTRRAT